LSESEMRQVKFDIENVMNQFNEKVLGSKWTDSLCSFIICFKIYISIVK
jgi:hypothetical protein